jgi:hypothetical protein
MAAANGNSVLATTIDLWSLLRTGALRQFPDLYLPKVTRASG